MADPKQMGLYDGSSPVSKYVDVTLYQTWWLRPESRATRTMRRLLESKEKRFLQDDLQLVPGQQAGDRRGLSASVSGALRYSTVTARISELRRDRNAREDRHAGDEVQRDAAMTATHSRQKIRIWQHDSGPWQNRFLGANSLSRRTLDGRARKPYARIW